MRVLVLGGGLIGLTSAYYLARGGATVTVVDEGDRPASGASHANGGLVTPCMSEPWNAPGVAWKLLRWIGRPDAPLRLRPAGLYGGAGWMLRFLRHSSPGAYRRNLVRNLEFGLYSLRLLRELRREAGLDYGVGRGGILRVFRHEATFEAARAASRLLEDHALTVHTLDRDGTIGLEPALAGAAGAIIGAQHFPDDETGDARRFCELLAGYLGERGVALHLGLRVTALSRSGSAISGARTEDGPVTADAVVVAAGVGSRGLLRTAGLELQVQPVKGYSLSVPLASWAPTPAIGVVDDDLHAVAAPVGTVLRVAGTAEFAGYDRTIAPVRIRNLQRFADVMFPHAARATHGPEARAWAGLRPMSADGVPIIGCTPVDGLYVNTGHGHLGWTFAAGSGRLLADLILNREPGIDAASYAYSRLH